MTEIRAIHIFKEEKAKDTTKGKATKHDQSCWCITVHVSVFEFINCFTLEFFQMFCYNMIILQAYNAIRYDYEIFLILLDSKTYCFKHVHNHFVSRRPSSNCTGKFSSTQVFKSISMFRLLCVFFGYA